MPTGRSKTGDLMYYRLQNYLLEHREVKLVRTKSGWRFMGPTGVIHRGRVPGTGRYHTRTIEQCCDSMCEVHLRSEDGSPEVVTLGSYVY